MSAFEPRTIKPAMESALRDAGWFNIDDIDEIFADVWARRLARHIAVAAALTRAWLDGWKRGYNTCADNWSGDSDRQWRPGCGRSVRP